MKQEMLAQANQTEIDSYLLEAFTFINASENYFGEELYRLILNEFKKLDHLIQQMDPNQPEAIENFYIFDPSIAHEIFKLAIVKFQEEEISLAIFVLLTLLNPENDEFWYRQGIAAQKIEKYDLALKAYEEALTINPDLIGAKLFLVECYLENGSIEKAKSQFAEAKLLTENTGTDEMWISFIKEIENITKW
ncbi:MAG: tetratricopeptide repeat protein [Candidatus Protochlamydia sp.]|nr:tetratricopeptide repeat protein [Candidatus Protochlamydia sp.]